eukprot:scaffold5.g993.t1
MGLGGTRGERWGGFRLSQVQVCQLPAVAAEAGEQQPAPRRGGRVRRRLRAAWQCRRRALTSLVLAAVAAAAVCGVTRGAAHTHASAATIHGEIQQPAPWERPQQRAVARSLRSNAGQGEGGGAGAGMAIPKILHQVYIGPPGDESQGSPGHQPWLEGCRYQYGAAAGWRHMFWNASAAEALLAEHVPWALAAYRGTDRLNERADIVRYAVLHKHGGLYLDSDVECWREGSDMLLGADVVVQGTWVEEGGCGTAMLASRPGEAVWEAALRLAIGRQESKAWDSSLQSIHLTGPVLLSDALRSVGVVRNATARLFEIDYAVAGTRYRIWPVFSWFQPCRYGERLCVARVMEQRAGGVMDMQMLVGMHRHAGSWIEDPAFHADGWRWTVQNLLCKELNPRRVEFSGYLWWR